MASVATHSRGIRRHGTTMILFTILAHLGGALVELAGALVALAFIRRDSMEQREG
jgi:hypothetical protein